MRDIVWDIETNGLLEESDDGLPKLDRVHCLVLKDVDTGERMSCTDAASGFPSIEQGLAVLGQGHRIYGHNILGFDIPVLQKLYPGWDHRGEAFDTLVMARTRFAHIKEIDFGLLRAHKIPSKILGKQTLESWGYRMGILKTDYQSWCAENGVEEPFAVWRPEMQDYAEQDVDVTEALLIRLRAARGLSKEVLEVEHKLARYLIQQTNNGWPFDFPAAVKLQGELAQQRENLGSQLREHFGTWAKPGKVFVPKRDNRRYGYVAGVPTTKVDWSEFNPASRDHIADRLQKLYGWKPKVFTPTGKPKVDETTLKGLDFPMANELVEYLTIDKRLGQLAEGDYAWLRLMRDDYEEGGGRTGMPHIHHSCSATTITHRHRHSHPNVSQVPSVEAPYGRECRSLFRVPEGWSIVGVDVSGLELRCLAHYMARYDGGEYSKVVLEGDIHSVNAEALGLERYVAKTWIYAYLYGAGNAKLGSFTLPPSASDTQKKREGKRLREQFEARIPALGSLSRAVRRKAQARYLNLIDGRRAYVRSPHSALNTLLQGTGSVFCKHWIVGYEGDLRSVLGEPGWDGQWAPLAWVHDEVQIAVNASDEAVALPRAVGERVVQAIRETGDKLGFRLPMDGEYKVGATWADTH